MSERRCAQEAAAVPPVGADLVILCNVRANHTATRKAALAAPWSALMVGKEYGARERV